MPCKLRREVDAAAETPPTKGKMPGEPEQPERHSGGSANGNRRDARSRNGRSTDPAIGDTADQAGADADQTLADGDQTLSDSDQSSSEHDQAQSDADQAASDRDQAASDHDRSTHAADDTEFMESFEASQEERAQGTAEREAATETRLLTTFERAHDATRRDEQAAFRDIQAAARDRAAELRDRATLAAERGARPGDAAIAKSRATAATIRASAAEDRARAAEDRAQAAIDRQQAVLELERAQLDDLTGFYRLGIGRAVLQREIDRSRRSGGCLVLAYCDVDGLKNMNDRNGHAAGDALLRAFADAIRSRVRSYDPVVRVGGDEFVCAFSNVDVEQAGWILSEIQDALGRRQPNATVSFGLAALRPDDSLASLMERSDLALREARSPSPSP